jgi:hypothetical protein
LLPGIPGEFHNALNMFDVSRPVGRGSENRFSLPRVGTTTRSELMTIAICFACGAIKFGALCACKKCAATPKSEDEIAVSLLLCDRHMRIPDLEALSDAMVSGEIHPVPDEKSMEVLRPAARDAQRMLGITPR